LMCAATLSVSSSPNTSIIVSTASIATHNSDSRLQTSRRNLPIFWHKKVQNEDEYCINTKSPIIEHYKCQNVKFLTKNQVQFWRALVPLSSIYSFIYCFFFNFRNISKYLSVHPCILKVKV
jgi:hypothetical protein